LNWAQRADTTDSADGPQKAAHRQPSTAQQLESNQDPLHLIHRHLIVPAIIQRRRTRGLMRRHLLREAAPAAIA
jgi:hypothetical protein